MQRTVRLESNSEAVLELVQKFLDRHQYGRAGKPQFLWRIVCEPDSQVRSTDLPLAAFSDLGLRYINLGQRGFVAVDLESCEAAAFIPERFFEDEPRFRHRPPLDILFCMTAASLGLTALSGACVGVRDRAILIFGPPNSGKTTAGYLAAKRGMKFHADQVVFLDNGRDGLRAWGDPFPAVFRPQAMEFLLELRQTTRHSTYGDLSFYYFDKGPLQARRARPLTPVCSVFLHRRATGKTLLDRIAPAEALSRLRDCLLFNEDARFDDPINAALRALTEKPVHNLQYASDPRIAANVIAELLR